VLRTLGKHVDFDGTESSIATASRPKINLVDLADSVALKDD
jgi:hypothetical protein